MIRIITVFITLSSFGLSQTSLYGLDGWYDISSVSTAGGTGAVSCTNSATTNPAGVFDLEKQFQLNIIKYPAGINAQSLLYYDSFGKSKIGIGLRHLGYGNFDEIDENGTKNGTYSAGDTWLNFTVAQNITKFKWGMTGGVFISNLEAYNATALVASTGILYDYEKINIRLGISLSNFGVLINHYTYHKEQLPIKIIFSANKKLTYLPLEINFDVSLYSHNNSGWRVGGVFSLPYNLKLLAGINSNNIDQRTEKNSIKSVLGNNSAGIAYTYDKYSIQIGAYSYGSGGWICGTGFNVKL